MKAPSETLFDSVTPWFDRIHTKAFSAVRKVMPGEEIGKAHSPSGVDKYPIRALWNSMIADAVYEHVIKGIWKNSRIND